MNSNRDAMKVFENRTSWLGGISWPSWLHPWGKRLTKIVITGLDGAGMFCGQSHAAAACLVSFSYFAREDDTPLQAASWGANTSNFADGHGLR